MRTCFRNAPATALAAMNMPALDIARALRGEFDYVHLFVTSQASLDATFPTLVGHVRERGMLWVSWPKARQLDSDLTLPHVIRIGYQHGMVESTSLSVDTTWSALKFTHPKPGKTYNNRYGRLPDAAARQK
jgi:hypothetical protein